ncbi:MAG: hypothetical protein IPK76_04255 [Lewinellaceae bacterium]|nr:hypothetical protein [Lewinellaceae bacterium]
MPDMRMGEENAVGHTFIVEAGDVLQPAPLFRKSRCCLQYVQFFVCRIDEAQANGCFRGLSALVNHLTATAPAPGVGVSAVLGDAEDDEVNA